MTDYIKREDVIGLAKDIVVPYGEKIGNHTTKPIVVYGIIDPDEVWELPSADVAEVVRCKDCKHYNEYENGEKIIDEEEVYDGWCMRWSGIENVNRHDYCSYGADMRGEA